MFKKTLFFFLMMLMPGLWASAHKFYTSLTQVEYNSKTQSAEVIMNLFTDDIEVAVSAYHKQRIKSSDQNFKSLCYQYLDAKFQVLDAENRILKNEYVGLEFNRDMVSVFFEIKVPQGLNKVKLKQTTLLEAFTEQTNIVNLKNGKGKTSLVYKAGTPDIQTVNFSL